jgi:predicted metal-dependent phosphoesterase TrpH
VYDALQQGGLRFPRASEVLAARDGAPSRLDDLAAVMRAHGYTDGMGRILEEDGLRSWITADLAAMVEAAHAIGALALIAHPGRGDGFARFDAEQLDQLRATIPIDGLEARHPSHTAERVEVFLEYAGAHRLLVSAGSDSHARQARCPSGIPPSRVASCRGG